MTGGYDYVTLICKILLSYQSQLTIVLRLVVIVLRHCAVFISPIQLDSDIQVAIGFPLLFFFTAQTILTVNTSSNQIDFIEFMERNNLGCEILHSTVLYASSKVTFKFRQPCSFKSTANYVSSTKLHHFEVNIIVCKNILMREFGTRSDPRLKVLYMVKQRSRRVER